MKYLKKLKTLLLCILALFSMHSSDASHASGGDLTYEHISGNTYQVTFKFFRDCDGINEPGQVTLCTVNLCNNQTNTTSLTKVTGNLPNGQPNGSQTSTGCPNAPNTCTSFSSPLPGYEEWWYRGNVTLNNNSTTCNEWQFSVSICCRNPSSNLQNATGARFYVEAYLNRAINAPGPIVNNNSPAFVNPPIPYFCVNQASTYNNGVQEVDGDSLSYSSVNPLDKAGCSSATPANISYSNAAYNPSNPFNTSNTFTVDPLSGMVNFTAAGIQTPVVTMRVEEYRNGQLIGYVMRDVQMVILNCSTPYPTLSIDTSSIVGGSPNNNGINVCAGDSVNFCFSVTSTFFLAQLSLTDNSASQAPGSTITYTGFGTDSVTGCMSWAPTLADTGLVVLTFTSIDSSCLPPGLLVSQIFTITLDISATLQLALSKVDPQCGLNNGSITAVASGSSNYDYNLMPGNITNNTGLFNNLAAGTYTVSATSGNCFISDTITLIAPNAPQWTTVSSTEPDCTNPASGTISSSASGGTGQLTYSISPGATSNTTGNFTGLSANTYTITVTDAANCSITTTVVLTLPPDPTWTANASVNVLCNGASTGSISVTAVSSGSSMSYNLMPGNVTNTTGNFNNLTAGIYTITATDNFGCDTFLSITITEPPALLFSAPTVVDVLCNGDSTGSIAITASGGTAPLTYNLQPNNLNNSTGTFNNLTAGTYTITATDANNCTTSSSVTIIEPTVLNITNVVGTTPSCVPGNDATITITASGGTTAYQYNIGSGNQASNIFNNVGAGNYTITVTDANGCTATSTIAIVPPNAPMISAMSATDVLCNGGSTGSITTTASGGTAPLSYNIMPGNVTNATGSYTNLSAGTYTVTVTDAIGCTISSTVAVNEPPLLIVDSTNSVDVLCNGDTDGSLIVFVSGGVTNYSYNLMPGNVTNGTGVYTNLGANTYTITVTDANNCTTTTSVTITEPPALLFSAPTVVDVLCNGDSTGSIAITASGGTAPLTYTMMPGNVTNGTGSYSNLTAGTYTITATDANNCTTSSSVTIIEPTVLNITNVVGTTPSCVPGNDATITVTASGGTITYQYSIGSGNQASNIFNNVGAGNYTITVTDANGCTATSTIAIVPPNAPMISAMSATDVLCNGGSTGSVTTTASGGTAPLSYNLMPGNVTNATGSYANLSAGTYTVTVTDAIGCTISSTVAVNEPPVLLIDSTNSVDILCNGDTDGSLNVFVSGGVTNYSYNLMPGNITNGTGVYTNLGANTYTITVTDANNCTTTTSVTITEPPLLVFDPPVITDVLCNGDSTGVIAMAATGGTAPLSYNLMPNNLNNSTGTFNNLTAGTYTITATDANNCTTSSSVTIFEPTVLNITNVVGTTPSCVPGNDATITITASGGTTAYQYNIGSGNQASNIFNNVGAGNYTITVTDANGCTATSTIAIVPPNAPMISAMNATDVLCNGGSTGSVTTTASGGTAPLSYNLMPGNVTNATGSYTNLSAGTYTVTVTDAIGCTISSTVAVNEPALLLIDSTNSVDVLCNGDTDGSLTVFVSGGVTNYSYNLMPGNVTNGTGVYTNLGANTYTITVTDANNCTTTTSVTITEPPLLVFDPPVITDVLCNGDSTGVIVMAATGGTAPLSYNLMPNNLNNSTGTFNNLTAGTYTITATDANNCTTSSSVTITEPTLLSITNVNSTIPSCVPGNDATITVTASGGTITYQYSIGSGNQASNVFNNVGAGNYLVTVTDNNGCTDTMTIIVAPPNAPSISAMSATDVLCNGGSTGSITTTASAGTAPLSYNLMPGNVTNATGTFTTLVAGTYSVIVTDAIGCSAQSSIIVNEPPALVIDSTNSLNVLCNGGLDGSLTVFASGGVTNYSYNLMPGNVTNAIGVYTNLGVNTYTITVTDANNCTTTTSITITEPPLLVFDPPVITDVLCNGDSTGVIAMAATGGTAPLSYNLMPNNLNNSTGTFNNLTAGTYTITATDANNCTTSSSVIITEPSLLDITNLSSTIPSCVPGGDATITITVAGGAAPYQFNIGGANQASNVFNNVSAGTYLVIVTDNNACSDTMSLNVVPPNSPTITSSSSVDVLCFGGNDGSLSVTASGGTGGLNYNLQPTNANNTTGIFNALIAGTYSITVTDAIGCTSSTSIIINEPPELLIDSLNTTNVLCFNGGDGSISVFVSGGTTNYSYNLMPGNVTNATGVFNSLVQNTYTITVTDANNCSTSTTAQIIEPDELIVDSTIKSDLLCFGDSTGSLQVFSSGGTPGFSYNLMPWNVTNNTGVFNGLLANTYSITITDTNNCSVTTQVQINEPPLLQISSITSTIPTCVPGNDASITVTAMGGNGGYMYDIGGPIQNSNVFNNVGSGTYTVTVTDANNCATSSTVVVAPPNLPVINSISQTNASCDPGGDATVTVNASGGVPGYTYSSDGTNFQGSNVLTSLAVGTYTITVSDASGCTTTTSVTITPEPSPTITNLSTTFASCVPGCDGTMTVTANGTASSVFTYSINGVNFQASNTFSAICTGNYTVTVVDANGCTATSVFNIQTATGPVFNSAIVTDVPCFGDSTGGIASNATSINGGIVYTINPNLGSQAPVGTFNNLPAGTYTITATDALGCTAQTTAIVDEPTDLIINNVNITPVLIAGQSTGGIGVNAGGGIPAYSYSINPNLGNFVAPDSFANLQAGQYVITVTDANGCTETSIVNVIQPDPILWDSVSVVNNLCFGDTSASIYVQAIGGLGPITYSIVPNVGSQNSPGLFTGLVAGTYIITALDSVGGFKDTTINVTEPTPIVVNSVAIVSPSCVPGNDGTIQINASGGSGILTYSIVPTANNVSNTTGTFVGLTDVSYTITITDTNNCTLDTIISIPPPILPQISLNSSTDISCKDGNNGAIDITATSMNGAIVSQVITPTVGVQATPGQFTQLTAGNYSIVVTDVLGCTASTTLTLIEPDSLVVDSTIILDVTCSGSIDGSIDVFTSGGNGGNIYSISPGVQTNSTGSFSPLPPGTYTITTTDSKGCSISTICIVGEPLPITSTSTNTNNICFGDSAAVITVTSNGGVPPFTYDLFPLGFTSLNGIFTGLPAGTFWVLITDANGCTDTVQNIIVTQPPQMNFISVQTQDITCFGDSSGSINVTAIGGTGPISYTLTPNIGTYPTIGSFENLPAYTYVVRATDSLGCIRDTVVTLNQNPEIYFALFQFTEPICHGDANGTIKVIGAGGVGSLKYVINGKPATAVGEFYNLAAGPYYITILDSLGCTKDTLFNMTEPDPVGVGDLEIKIVTCPGADDGKIFVTGSGGRGSFTYYLRPGLHINKTGRFQGLAPNYYTITIKDSAGCQYDTIVNVGIPTDLLSTTIQKQDLGCWGEDPGGWAEVFPIGGLPPYTYLWSSNPGQITPRANNLRYGWQFVTVTDANGCEVKDTTYIDPAPCCNQVFIPTAFTPNGDGNNDVWRIRTVAGISLIQLDVFNRWGQRVWTTQDYGVGWDGTFKGELVSGDTYYYIFRYICLTDQEKYIKKGDLTVLR